MKATLGPGDFDLVVFDVGQGQAIAVRTANHLVLYDLGPGWLEGDAGERIVLPWLRRQGLTVSLALVSHGDNDHAGGLNGLSDYIAPWALYSGEPERVAGSQPCSRGQHWQLDGVNFHVLWPLPGIPLRHANNRSCVLLIESPAGRALLTGDITHSVEFWLSARDAMALDVLQAPHHGSPSSSSYTFLRAFPARYAVASAGYNNRFDHPSQRIRQRYDELGVPLYVTGDDGMIVFRMRDSDNSTPVRARQGYLRPWRPL